MSFGDGLVALLVVVMAACGADSKSDDGKGGSASGGGGQAGASGGATSGSSPRGGEAGNGGKALGGSLGTAGKSGGPSGGDNAGSGNTGTELAASHLACTPACPRAQYCALLEVDCSGKACIVEAVCKDRPRCSTATDYMCPRSPMETCVADPDLACEPDEPGCSGACVCNENANPCAPQGLDSRPSVCDCVELKGEVEFCSDLECPIGTKCAIELGAGYCVLEGRMP